MLAAAVVSGVVAFSVFGQAPAAPAPTPVTPIPGAPAAPPAPAVKPAPAKLPGGLAGDAAPAAPGPKKEKQTFLGLNMSQATAATREELKLGRAVGLKVDAVDPGGPAEQAGLKPGDVIEKLDDQFAFNVKQLTAIIRAAKPGDEITLSIHRDGKPQTIKAKLGQKEVVANPPQANVDINFDQAFQVTPPPQAPVADLVWAAPRAGAFMQNIVGKQQSEWADDTHRIRIDRENGQTVSMVISDTKTGKTLMEARPPDPKAIEEMVKTMPELKDKIRQAEQAMEQGAAGKTKFFGGGRGIGGGGAAGGFGAGGGFGGGIAPPQPAAPGGVDVFVQNGVPGAPQQAWVVGRGGGVAAGGGRGRVATWQDDDQLMILRMVGNTPIYLLALSKKDGRTLYDGPVMTEEQRRGLPAEVAEPFDLLKSKPDIAKEFGGPQTREKLGKAEQPPKTETKEAAK
jgi:membrane-associated protease RseP (regulator of RpoE activity)